MGTWSVAFRSGETLSGQSYGEPLSGGYGFFLYPDAVAPCVIGPGPGTGLVQYVPAGAAVTPTRLTATLGRGMHRCHLWFSESRAAVTGRHAALVKLPLAAGGGRRDHELPRLKRPTLDGQLSNGPGR